jgi:multiple sugar transport system permease protein
MASTALAHVHSDSRRRRHLRESLEGYLWASPWLIGFVIFIAGPMLASIGLSFSLYDLAKPPRFIGLENFEELVTDSRVPRTMLTTTIFALATVPANLLMGLGLALLVNMKIRGIGVWRTLYYLPAVTPAVAYAQIWIWLFNKDYGLINAFLSIFGIDGPGWLVDSSWVLPSLIIMTFWGVGGSMIINLAGLQGIPTHLYEAAEIDGAGGLSKFWHITVPMMSPVVFYNLVIGVIGALQAFTIIFIVTGGKEDGMTFMVYLYKQAFGLLRMGYGSAMAWLLFLYILLWTLLIFRSGRSWVYYEGQLRGR